MTKERLWEISLCVGCAAVVMIMAFFILPLSVKLAQGETVAPHPRETRSALTAALGAKGEPADGCTLFRTARKHQAATAARWAEKRSDDDALTENALSTARMLIKMQDLDCS